MTTKKSDPEKIYSKSKLTKIVKKQKQRIKKLEAELTAVKESDDRTRDEFARIVATTDRMGIALRACMKALKISRDKIVSS